MQIDIATLFPEMCDAVLQESILGRAQKSGAISVQCWNIRDYTLNKHKRVDDVPYGGGRGMVMQADPIYRCWEAVCAERESKPHCIYLSPKGSVFTQQKAVALSQLPHLFLLCGHYEGIDQRILDTIIDEEISIGDYVLTGGELPALVLTDAVARMCEGVLPDAVCLKRRAIITACWNIRSIPVQKSGMSRLFRQFYCPDTTKILKLGGLLPACRKPKRNVRIFMQSMLTKNREKQLPHFNKL